MGKGGPPSQEAKIIYLRAMGGEVTAAAALAPKVGPLGMSPKKVGDDIKKATGDWKGQKVTVKLTVVNRQAAVSVVPSAAAWLIKELGQKFAMGQPKIHNGNLSLDQVIGVAKKMRGKSIAHKMSGTVKEILGTAFSIGCTVGGKHPRDVQKEIDSGDIVIEDYEAPAEEAEE